MAEKDNWDKFEIVGKIVVGLTVPVVVAVAAYFLNTQISERTRSSEMTRIAVGVLSKSPSDEDYNSELEPMRRWAIGVLQNPTADHPLSEDEADLLLRHPIFFDGFGGDDGGGSGSGGRSGDLNIVWVPWSEVSFTEEQCASMVKDLVRFGRPWCVNAYPEMFQTDKPED
ncbi:hypothetical protein RXV86_12980 [Alisedimentitalea sp. MJ-SS2]|uniref:hypothetical protein n=1 Tax=Aliisedimentitalea sp. MJ-SS2 TaxID=3049795 RepID=UPI0029078FFE|nr:hypothetical protein [Alisedimentitalea sp. MJ-SS2]MDU8928303.1 hypothetical protein [Alisedimentitalea sp. MJ-SS2]